MKNIQQIRELQNRINQSIIGQEKVVEKIMVVFLADGNLLLEGLPGLAKTRAIKSLSKELKAALSRIQFTPDLLPSDITGSEMYLGEDAEERFVFQPGPIFGNLILADEINRAPAKVQSALLEAMEERQVTVAGKTHAMPDLFMVLATQNPVEQEGSYPLPEAQMDRFLMHILIAYPDAESELEVIRLVRGEQAQAEPSDNAVEPIDQHAVFAARAEIDTIKSPEPVERYILGLVGATRNPSAYGEELGRRSRGALVAAESTKGQRMQDEGFWLLPLIALGVMLWGRKDWVVG
jgi:MoxR-like ATPase